MSQRRTPPKQRHRERTTRTERQANLRPNDDSRGYSAPGHLAGHFEQHDHGSGHGPFGFTQHVLP